MKLSIVLPTFIVALAAVPAVPVGAQTRVPEKAAQRQVEIPVSSRPPAGMCRVWLDDVPAAQQPAPTDCATAVRNRSAKGRVIFGDDYVKKGKAGDSTRGRPPIKGFAPGKRKP